MSLNIDSTISLKDINGTEIFNASDKMPHIIDRISGTINIPAPTINHTYGYTLLPGGVFSHPAVAANAQSYSIPKSTLHKSSPNTFPVAFLKITGESGYGVNTDLNGRWVCCNTSYMTRVMFGGSYARATPTTEDFYGINVYEINPNGYSSIYITRRFFIGGCWDSEDWPSIVTHPFVFNGVTYSNPYGYEYYNPSNPWIQSPLAGGAVTLEYVIYICSAV